MPHRTNESDREEEVELVQVLRALADPVRLKIVRQLNLEGEKPCGSFDIKMPKSSMSHHFRVLRESGVIASDNRGTVIMNRLQTDDLNRVFPGLLHSVLNGANRELKPRTIKKLKPVQAVPMHERLQKEKR